MNQHESHAETVEQRDVVNQVGKVFVLRNRAPQHQHKGLAPVCVDVGCSVSQPANVVPPRRCHVVVQAIEK